jgi:UDP-N-acetylmuramate dehydrogenase
MIIEKEKPLSSLTSWKIGGPAKVLLIPDTKEELKEAVSIGKESGKFYVLGKGTNLLVKDEGVSYPLIKLGDGFNYFKIDGDNLLAGASSSLISLAVKTAGEGFKGFEFASGIPGSLGGAVIMNAGAHGSEIKDILVDVLVYDTEKEEYVTFRNEELKYSYRNSFLKNNSRYIVVEANLKLSKGDKKLLMENIKNTKIERMSKQPYEYPNGGSVFKNPPGMSAGKLIEESGLKGLAINDAQVSEKHGNFIINKGNAKAADVINLIEHIEKVIKEKYNINLEREIIIIG